LVTGSLRPCAWSTRDSCRLARKLSGAGVIARIPPDSIFHIERRCGAYTGGWPRRFMMTAGRGKKGRLRSSNYQARAKCPYSMNGESDEYAR
jgi:hypothetical protein